jgi:hypothetical protein
VVKCNFGSSLGKLEKYAKKFFRAFKAPSGKFTDRKFLKIICFSISRATKNEPNNNQII